MSSDGQRIAIGSPYTDVEGDLDKGEVRMYRWNENCNNVVLQLLALVLPYVSYEDIGPCWDQMGAVIQGSKENDRFGSKVSLSGDGSRVAVAATQANGVDGTTEAVLKNAGSVRVYDWKLGIVWFQRGTDVQGSDEYAGFQLDVVLTPDGRRLIVGRSAQDNARGRAYAYEWDAKSNDRSSYGGDNDDTPYVLP